ncbi:MAG: hypothetical protein Q7T25_02540 [Sideroxyarcus sp.]|nr:hypothetical protein [Sideroxyarcus sp.]
MKLSHTLLASLFLLSSLARAEGCLNNDPKRGSYPSGDPRNATYVRCTPSGTAGAAGSVGAIGNQVQGMIERRNAQEDEEMRAFRAQRDYNWEHGGREREANRFRNLKRFTAHEASIAMSGYEKVGVYPNANINDAQRSAIRSEILAAADSGKLLETFPADGYDDVKKAWASSTDPVANAKVCEVGAQLARSLVYGEFIPVSRKNPAKGFAIAQAGCSAWCGGACYALGRMLEDGDGTVPGADKFLGKEPLLVLRRVWDIAIVNEEPGAMEREAMINWRVLPRFVDKTYYEFSSFSSRSYWINGDDDLRLAYQQLRQCLRLEPTNISCARSINLMIQEFVPKKIYYLDGIAREITPTEITYYRDYLTKLEGVVASSQK